jgi:hypothetical protein
MSSEDSSPTEKAASPPPALGPVLRYYAPRLGLGLFVVAIVVAYVDLRFRIDALEAATHEEPPETGVTPAEEGPVVVHGAAPAWSCSGALSGEVVRRSIGQLGPAVLRCYERRVVQAPGLRGLLVLRLRVDGTGAVDAVHVAGIEDDELVECAGNEALRWRFPAPEGGACAIVEAPFALGDR